MSYEVLARKWRPLTFDELVGQDHITRTLKKAVETDRLSHAYMLSGPRGCGKTSTARILARVINCENPPGDGNPCNQCASCLAVIKGNNLDVMEIDGASHTGVSEVRDLQESIGYTPSQFANKVYIIDEVHMLSTHAFNALLKTLEEPPKHVYFIFATTVPQKILDTIKSRCQRHHFKRLEIKEISGRLRDICEAEKVKFDEEGLRLLARKADGSMRDGTSLLDQCITSSDGNITTDSVRDILGLIDQEKIFAFMESIASGDPTGSLRLLNGCVDEGLDIQELSSALLEGYRDLMLLATPGDLSDLLFTSRDDIELMRGLLASYELPDLVTIVERLCDTTPRLKSAADPRIVLESLLVDLALLDRQVDIRELVSGLNSPGGAGSGLKGGKTTANTTPAPPKKENRSAAPDKPSAGSAQVPPPGENDVVLPARMDTRQGPEPPDVEVALDAENLGELWGGFVTFVRQKKVRLGVCLISGKVHSLDGNTLTLRFARNFSMQKEQVEDPENMEFLKRMITKYFGRKLDVSCFMEGDEQAVKLEQKTNAARSPVDNLRGIPDEKKPAVKKLLDAFDGEIIRYNNDPKGEEYG
jgi:DNA polymerase-3 subunit gamma/tau